MDSGQVVEMGWALVGSASCNVVANCLQETRGGNLDTKLTVGWWYQSWRPRYNAAGGPSTGTVLKYGAASEVHWRRAGGGQIHVLGLESTLWRHSVEDANRDMRSTSPTPYCLP